MKSFAKINIFLKITAKRGNYHEIASRFVLIEELFDEICFVNSSKRGFHIISNIKIEGENSIQKAYYELEKIGFENELREFFQTHVLKLEKNIPIGGGLGGGNSNAALFLTMINEELGLKIPLSTLMKISKNIGADTPFFLSGFKSANVTGIGEIVEEFDDQVPQIFIKTNDIFCPTKDVYDKFRKDYMSKIDTKFATNLLKMSSNEILSKFDGYTLNDLALPCSKLYGLNLQKGEFLSGSGSTIFSIKDAK